ELVSQQGDRGRVGRLQVYPCVERQGHAERVETRAQVGRAGRRPGDRAAVDAHAGHHGSPSGGESRAMASSTAALSAGTVTGSVRAERTAMSGSFGPCPVSTHTTLPPPRKTPSRFSLRTPASEAADAGSAKIPSLTASIR